MRTATRIGALASVAFIALVACRGAATPQPAATSCAVESTNETKRVIDTYIAARQAGDVDRALAQFAPDATFRHFYGTDHRGLSEIRLQLETTTATYRIENDRPSVCGETATWAEAWTRIRDGHVQKTSTTASVPQGKIVSLLIAVRQ